MKFYFLYVIIFFSYICQSQNVTSFHLDSMKNELAHYTNDDTVRASLYVSLGNAIYLSDPSAGKAYTDSGLILSTKLNWTRGIASCFNQLGSISVAVSDYPSAISYFQKALKAGEALHNEKLNNAIELNLGLVYLSIAEYDRALNNFRKLLVYAETKNDPSLAAYALNNIGIAFLRLQQPDSTIYYLNKGIPIAEANNMYRVLSFSYSNLGAAFDLKKDYLTAEKKFLLAIEIADQINDLASKAQSVIGLAEVNTFLKNYDKAVLYCNQAIELSKQTNNMQLQKEAYAMLADIYSDQKKFEEALFAYKNFIQLRDSMMNDEKKSDIIKRDLEFKNEKAQALAQAELKQEKEKQNLYKVSGIIIFVLALIGFIFYKRNRDAKQAQKEIASALRIKDTELKALRLQMNPHFIDNSLQSIQYFMKNHNAEEAEAYLLKFSCLMRAMLMHSERDEIPLEKELETLEWYMQLENLRMKFPFKYTITIDEHVNAQNTTIPPNILQPFVENAVKHGLLPKNAPGTINILIYKKDNELHVIVEDDGVGRDKAKTMLKPALFKHESLGIKITQERLNILNRMKKIHAALTIIDLNNNDVSTGTRVELNLPYQI